MPESGENITLLMDPAATVKNLSITLLRGKRADYHTVSELSGLIITLLRVKWSNYHIAQS